MANDLKNLTQLAGIFLLIVSVFFIALTVGTIRKTTGATEFAQVTFDGTGSVEIVPDTAKISYSVRVERNENAAADEALAERIDAITSALTSIGIEETQISTENFSITENRIWIPEERQYERDGWIGSATVVAMIKNTDLTEEALRIGSTVDDTEVSGPNFMIGDVNDYLAAAREEAVDDARKKAESVADSLGMKLGRLIGFYEWEDGGSYPEAFYSDRAVSSSPSGGGVADINLFEGQEEVTINVSLTYRLR